MILAASCEAVAAVEAAESHNDGMHALAAAPKITVASYAPQNWPTASAYKLLEFSASGDVKMSNFRRF